MGSLLMSVSPSHPEWLKIGDVAKVTGTTLRTLRYYEELQLIEPDNRSKGNYRLYAASVVQRILLIASLKKLGFSLDEIKDMLGPTLSEDMQIIERTKAILTLKKQKIMQKLEELNLMHSEVEVSLKLLESCMACKFQQPHQQCDPECEYKHNHI
jgi:DNA-binding transcriptional MerR regulator